jgi:Flp pilus assembly pilin Flp
MGSIKDLLRKLWHDESGQDMLEYVFAAAVLALGIVVYLHPPARF